MPDLPDSDSGPSPTKKFAGKAATGAKSLTSGASKLPESSVQPVAYQPTPISSYKKGGKVKKTGLAKVHRGERVLTKRQEKKYEKGKR